MTLTSGDRELRAPAGSWVQVPAGVQHTVAVTGAEPVHLLDVHTPSCGFGAFLRALHERRRAAARGRAVRVRISIP